MKIAFDVDGVVLNSIELILDCINEMKGTQLQPEKLFSWDLEAHGLDMGTLRTAVDHMYSQRYIAPYDGAVEVLSRVHGIIGEPLLFITGRSRPGTAERQLQALDWNGNPPEMVVIGGNRDKREYLAHAEVDFIVEDDPEYLEEYVGMGVGVGLMLRPWNRSFSLPSGERFEGWNALHQWFLEHNGAKRAHN
ncbi:MAG: hypothetical protein AB1646_01505 [Thermodesulfobacteriota bacterium]